MRARSLKRQAADRAYEPTRQAILVRDPLCLICGYSARDVHHRKQRSLGGSDSPANLVGLCRTCHSDVHDHVGLYTALGLLLHGWESEDGYPLWHNAAGYWATPTPDGWERWHNTQAGDAVDLLKDHLDDRFRLAAKVHDSIPGEEL